MNPFLIRAITAIGFAVVVIAGLVFNKWTLLGLMLIVQLGSILEFYKISQPLFKKDKKKLRLYSSMIFVMSILTTAIAFVVSFQFVSEKYIFSIPLILAAIFYIELFLRSKKPFRNIGLNLLAMYYISMPIALLFFISNLNGMYSGVVVLGVLFIVWGNDSGAYIAGSLIGKNKLIPHISPNKTIEGFVGGGLLCFLVAYLNVSILSECSFLEGLSALGSTVWYLIAGIIFIFATIGDLVESLLKRSLEIKDSGTILPGHGGFLDRFDAFLFVLPFIVAVIKIFN